jgi:hypothetical protein
MADQRDEQQSGQSEQSGGKRVVGRGMTSPDSTEAVLDASTGEPDPRARGTSGQGDGDDAQDRGTSKR